MAADYSLIITWTYFSIYAFTFLIVSIVCAREVIKKRREELAPNQKKMSKKKAFIEWAKLLWKKKKVYVQLVPHFFDQATDFGVIYEYWNIYQSGGDPGINTLYLFGVSIAIIILHRIVSSAAIYRLTKSWTYSVLQVFDALMIQCIYTNYLLDTDEPSNAQRYLQVLEATFEVKYIIQRSLLLERTFFHLCILYTQSAPQILISTAYLVKAENTDISAVVYISLITSFWTLAGRVASDDKAMMSKAWQGIEFSHKRFPCINGRYILRVVFWRFLEISSRVCLLTIVWINMGGFTVFLLLGLELTYLVLLSYGLGTLDIMGNIVYLRAANSNTASKRWGQRMTYYFWIYRVISTYILLLTCTIFATTKFDGPLIQGFRDRNNETIVNSVGLMIFVYCWIATPLWQWIGGLIVYDHVNLQSISRDIDQLVEDDKWFDVWELIKFGASEYDPEHALRKLYFANDINEKVSDILGELLYDLCKEDDNTNWNGLLLIACQSNKIKFIKQIFDQKDNIKLDVNNKDKFGRTPIFYCYKLEIIEYLVKEHGASCNITDENGDNISRYYINSEFNAKLQKVNKEKCDETDKRAIIKLICNEINDVLDADNDLRKKPDGDIPLFDEGALERTITVMDEDKGKTKIKWKIGEKTYEEYNITRLGNLSICGLPFLAMFIVIDIVLLALEQTDHCESINNEYKVISSDAWIFYGAISSLIISAIFLCSFTMVFCVGSDSDLWTICSITCGGCISIFYIVWASIGVDVYKNMDTTTANTMKCTEAVVAWIVLKFIAVAAVCCCCPCTIYQVFDGACFDWSCWKCWECKCCGGEYVDDGNESDDDFPEDMNLEMKLMHKEMKKEKIKTDKLKIRRFYWSQELIKKEGIKEMDIPDCDCKQQMILIKAENANMAFGEVVHGSVCACDECKKTLQGDTLMWHCDAGKVENVHENGYRLCVDCAKKRTKQKELDPNTIETETVIEQAENETVDQEINE